MLSKNTSDGETETFEHREGGIGKHSWNTAAPRSDCLLIRPGDKKSPVPRLSAVENRIFP